MLDPHFDRKPARRRLAFVALVVAVLAGGCTESSGGADGGYNGLLWAPKPLEGTLRIAGSTALEPLLEAARDAFVAKHPRVKVQIASVGSLEGLEALERDAVHIGASDIPAPASMRGALEDTRVAVVGFAAMAHDGPYNAQVTALTRDQLAQIFLGVTTNWKELGGEDQRIVLINRTKNSGTRAVFGRILFGGDQFADATEEGDSAALVKRLKETKGAISYMSLSYRQAGLKVLAFQGKDKVAEPTDENIADGSYPIWAYEHLYTKKPATGIAREFLLFVRSPEFQETVLPRVGGFIPVDRATVKYEEE